MTPKGNAGCLFCVAGLARSVPGDASASKNLRSIVGQRVAAGAGAGGRGGGGGGGGEEEGG